MEDGVTFADYPTKWVIEHVIPLNMLKHLPESQHHLLFHWTNIMPACPQYNLEKNKRLDADQIEHHLVRVRAYHKVKRNLTLNLEYIELLAKHLVAGNPYVLLHASEKEENVDWELIEFTRRLTLSQEEEL
jgi:hypothetical protein